MKLALISDIHGNLEALQAVLRDIDSVKPDLLFSLGDVIGYGCDPSACIALVDKHFDVKLMGNHEYLILGKLSGDYYNKAARFSADWTQSTLSEKEMSIISDYEFEHIRDDLYFTHSSPFEPQEWNYILAPEEALWAFGHLKHRLCFVGHTHVPMIFTEMADTLPRSKAGHSFVPDEELRYIINVGSVGQPRDDDPRACYVTYDTADHDVDYRRIEYDVAATQHKMTEAKLPRVLIDRLAMGR